MSLKVWLPLNGTLDNQGLEQVVAMNTNVVYANGKIGKCLSSNSSSSIVSFNISNLVSLLANGEKYSLACWIKLTNNASSGWIIKFGSNSCGLWWARSSPRLVWNENDSGKRSATSIASDYNNWHHVVTTVDKSVSNTIKLVHYVDGILSDVAGQIFDNSTFLQPAGETLTLYPYNALLNDVRLYDHILSPMEVKQISQGLILHYPLNNNGFGQKNLHKNSDTITSTWSINQGTVSNGVVTITPSSGSDRRIYQMPANGGWSWESNKTYTASIDARSPNGAILIFYPYGAGSMNKSYTVTSQWKRYSFTFIATQSGTASMTYHVSQTSGVTLQLKHPKLELGQKATPWCPNEADKLYTILKLNDNIEYDCSGYCHNGIKNGNITYSNDIIKYNTSMIFNGSEYINIGQQLFNIKDEITVNLWVKANDWTTNPGTFFSSVQAGGYGWQKNNNAYRVYCGTGISSNTYISVNLNTTTLDASKWHMMTITYDGMVLKTYIDGVLKTTTSKYSTKTPLFFNSSSTMFIGGEADSNQNIPANTSSYPNFKGKISDVRIYCTTLSAEDVILLYNNSAYIDNQGNIYSAMYEEV